MKTLKEVGKMEDKEKVTQDTSAGCGSAVAVILAAAPAAAAIPTAEAALRREAVEASLRVCWLKPTALTTSKKSSQLSAARVVSANPW